MKKIIQIEIEYPDCDELNIDTSDLMDIKNETMNQLDIVEDVFEGRFKIGVKVVKPINEEEIDRAAKEYEENYPLDDPGYSYYCYDGFKAGVKYLESKII